MGLQVHCPARRGADTWGALLVGPGQGGETVEVALPGRAPVRLQLPPGLACGTRVRLRGLGGAGGDLYLEVHVLGYLGP